MMLKTKRNVGIINAITMLAVNVIYMIAVAVNGMSFIAFAGFEVPIDANLMVLLYLFSLILNMVAYAFFKRELTKKNKLILTLALLVNAILGMSGVISVLSIMSLFLINSNYDSDKEVEFNSLIKYIIVGFIIGAGISYVISTISTNLFIALCEGMLIGLGASINIKFIKLK